MQWVRSLLFTIIIYGAMAVIGLAYFPLAVFSRKWAFRACKTWCDFTLWCARWLVGIRTEVRGTPPTGEVMIAAKHQSFLDIILIFNSIPAGKFIMKKELVMTPIIGQYALKIGCVPVDRGKRGKAIGQMLQDVKSGAAEPGQLIIYPQGTRVAPGLPMPYKVGTGALYTQLGQTCVPVATNVGHFWPRKGIIKRPGLAVVEFLEPIPPGLSTPDFMRQLEREVEAASTRLSEEATA